MAPQQETELVSVRAGSVVHDQNQGEWEFYKGSQKAVPAPPRRLRGKEAGAKFSRESSSVCTVVVSRGKMPPAPDR